MAKRPDPQPVSDDQVRRLLERYNCPVPFHEVRTRFLGNIATPLMSISPLKLVQDLWGRELPTFDTTEEANELVGALIMGLWNRLTRHQDRSAPFRLVRIETKPTRQDLAVLALMRRQELDGFIEGLFGGEEVVDLPERAHQGLDHLGLIRAFFAGVIHLTADETKTKPASESEMEKTVRLMREMTREAEQEMHAIVLACKRARRDTLVGAVARKPTFH
jgi:hypothetical protein